MLRTDLWTLKRVNVRLEVQHNRMIVVLSLPFGSPDSSGNAVKARGKRLKVHSFLPLRRANHEGPGSALLGHTDGFAMHRVNPFTYIYMCVEKEATGRGSA